MFDAGGQRDRPFHRLDDIGERDRRRRARQLEPAAGPRELRSKPAAVSRLTSFCTVGAGRPVSSASSLAEIRAPLIAWLPQWRAEAAMMTTA